MRIEIAYTPDVVMQFDTPEELSDKEVQDFLMGKLTLHGTSADGVLQSFGGRNALWVNRYPATP